ncbi:MAG: alcohol dehydrogenase catalytic domain-containing protein, partial [Planctomycetes bacterium]|nr:alcohol dehydrogenase catalytic domain-containing protein [Planctomycetota bacterium]
MIPKKVPDPFTDHFTSKAAVFVETGRPLEIREFEVPPGVEADAALCKVTMSAICGSDLHTIDGRRRPSGPIVLGHEICGTIVRLGRDVSCDFTGRLLAPGDRVTWSIAASCGQCFYCRNGIPQKCESLFKYGHQDINTKPPLSGGFAEYVYLTGGTALFRLPDALSDRGAVFANCSLATMAAAVRLAELREGEAVLVQGAGLVGLCAAALAGAHRPTSPAPCTST